MCHLSSAFQVSSETIARNCGLCSPLRLPLLLVLSGDVLIGIPCGNVVRLYSVRGLERSELGGSHGCPERLWDRNFLQVYTPSKASCLLSFG